MRYVPFPRQEAIARGRQAARSPQARAKMSTAKVGKPSSPELRAAALEAAKRPKAEARKLAMSLCMKQQWAQRLRTSRPPGRKANTSN
jgi:hypothetical protein